MTNLTAQLTAAQHAQVQSIRTCQWFIEDSQRWIAILEEELTEHPEQPRDYAEQIIQQQEQIADWQARLEAHKAELAELQPETTETETAQSNTRQMTTEELTAYVAKLNAAIDNLDSAKFTKDSAGEYSLYIPEIEFEFYVNKTPQGWAYLSESHTSEDIGKPPLATKKEAANECKGFIEYFIGCLIETAPTDEFDFYPPRRNVTRLHT